MSFTIDSIYRYPIKSGSSEPLTQISITKAGIEEDRQWALVSPNHSLLPNGEWMSCNKLEQRKIRPIMATWKTVASESGVRIIIDDKTLDLVEGQKVTIDNREVQLAKAKQGFWDDESAKISIINLNTVDIISEVISIDIDPLVFRANIYVRAEPWVEMDWIGKQVRINDVRLNIFMPTERCSAISVDLGTGEVGPNLLALIAKHFGHPFCGVYAEVQQAGQIAIGDTGKVVHPTQTTIFDTAMFQASPSDIKNWPRQVEIVYIVEETKDIRSLWLSDPFFILNVWQDFKAGQHIRFHNLEKCGTWRNYTISGYKDGLFRVTVKQDTGGGSNRMHSLKVGDRVIISGPQGDLVVDKQAKAVHIMTAGIGITPAVAMINDLRDLQGKVRFTHTTRHNQMALWHEITGFANTRDNINAQLFISDGNCKDAPLGTNIGRPDIEGLAKQAFDEEAQVIICGPLGFSTTLKTALEQAGVPNGRIGSETFASVSLETNLQEAPSNGPHKVRFIASNIEAFWHRADGTLLDLAERHGIMPTAGCRAGICEKCKVDLDSGEVAQLSGTPVSNDEVLLCCSVPVNDVIIRI